MTDRRQRDEPSSSACDREQVLVAKIVVSATDPAECTIFPRDVAEGDRLTTWLSAREGSFVALAEMR